MVGQYQKTKKFFSSVLVSFMAFSAASPASWASMDENDGFTFRSSKSMDEAPAFDLNSFQNHKVPWFSSVNPPPAAWVARSLKSMERHAEKASESDRFVTDEVIVRFKKSRINLKDSAGLEKSERFWRSKKLKQVDAYAKGNFSVMRSTTWENAVALMAKLKNDPDVEFVQPNFKYYTKASTSWSNDSYASSLWGLENKGQNINGSYGLSDSDADVPEAWAVNEWTNTGIIVAVIDSGVAYNHPDLLANMWDGSNCKNESGVYIWGCVHGYDYQDDDKNPLPTTSDHGTHVAGTIAAVKNNSVGIAGVAPKAKIMAIKFGGTTATVVKSINFAKQNGAKVINASFGDAYVSGTGYNHSLLDVALYEAIRDFPGIFVAAAGNDSRNHDSGSSGDMMYPAGFRVASSVGPGLPNVIAVAATDQYDSLASFSDYGSKSVDLGAPGTNVYSTVPSSAISRPYFENFSSVSSPDVPSNISKNGGWWTFDIQQGYGNVLFWDLDIPYAANANSLATFPTVNLKWAEAAAFDFYAICDTSYDKQYLRDYMSLEISADGSNYVEYIKWNEPAIDGDNDPSGAVAAHFQDMTIPDEYLTSSFRYRFRWVTDGSDNNYFGCAVDDVSVLRSDLSDGSDNKYAFKAGTSMAAPHVAGAVALAWGYSPSSSVSEIVNAVVNSGDPLSSLSGKTVSGKRLNAYKALSSLLVPSVTSLGAYRDSSKSVAIGSGAWLTGSLSPYFAWTSTGSAVSYNVNVDRSASFAQFGPVPSGNFYSGSTVATAYSGSNFSTDGSYSFCVRGKWSAAQLGDWKCAWMKIDSTWPAAPVVVSPSNGVSVGATLASLNWNVAADAGIGMGSWSYRFEVATDSGMSSPVLSDSTASTWTSVVSLDDGTYFWRVRATDSLGNVGAWTSVRSFTKDTVPPAAPTEVSLNGGNFVNAANQSSLVLTAKSSAEESGSKARYFVSIAGKSVTGLWTVASDGAVRITGVNVSSLGDGELDVSLRIEDLIGNVSSTGSSTVFKDAIPPTGSLSFVSGALTNSGIALVSLSASEPVTYELTGTGLAESYSGTLKGPLNLSVALSEWDGPKIATVTYRDAGGSTSPAYVARIILDTVPPSLSSLSAADGDTVTGSPFALSGKASDTNGIAAVKVNGSQAAGTDSWSVQLPIVGGTNRLSVVAYDRAGNSVSQELSVVRVPSKPAPQVSVTAKDAVRVSFATDVDATGSVVYGTSLDALDVSVADASYSKSHAIPLSGLSENTRYYYRAFGSVEGRDGPMSVTGSFVTPKSVESSAVASSRKYDAPLHVSDGTPDGVDVPLSDRIEIRSSNGSWSIIISAGSLKITAASGNWDKIISPPEFVSYSGGLSVEGYAVIPEYAAKAGSESDSISFSGAKVTVRMPVPARLNGKVLKVYRSEDSQATFAFVASCTVAQSICEFDTPGFSVFVPLEGSDSVPDQFAFESVVNALPGSEVVSKPVKISGINVTVTAASSNATLVVDGKDAWTSAEVNSGASISLKVRASENSWDKIVGTLTVGGISAWFQVTSGDKPVSASSGGLYGGGGGSGGWSPYFGASSSGSSQTNASPAGKPAVEADDSSVSSGSKKNFAVKDVSGHWSKQYVLNLVRLGIVNNAPKFRPDDSLTRAEFLKIALNAAEVEIPGSVSDSKFSDVSADSWYAPYVAVALERGVISWNSDKFRPDDRITRAEVAKILSGLLDDAASEAGESGIFSDVPKESEFAAPISLLYAKGLFSGQVSGDVRVFRPADSITRAEIAKVTSIGFELASR